MNLSREFWVTLIFATVALVVCQGLQLAAPNLQGRIIDAISHGIKDRYQQSALVATHRGLIAEQNLQSRLELGIDPALWQLHKPFPLGGLAEPDEPAFATCDVDASLLWTTGFFLWTGDGLDQLTDSASTAKFYSLMRLYVIIQVLSGLFSGLKSLGIQLAMRALAAVIRKKLFHSMIAIDINYFDAMNTGQLTSRLTND